MVAADVAYESSAVGVKVVVTFTASADCSFNRHQINLLYNLRLFNDEVIPSILSASTRPNVATFAVVEYPNVLPFAVTAPTDLILDNS